MNASCRRSALVRHCTPYPQYHPYLRGVLLSAAWERTMLKWFLRMIYLQVFSYSGVWNLAKKPANPCWFLIILFWKFVPQWSACDISFYFIFIFFMNLSFVILRIAEKAHKISWTSMLPFIVYSSWASFSTINFKLYTKPRN